MEFEGKRCRRGVGGALGRHDAIAKKDVGKDFRLAEIHTELRESTRENRGGAGVRGVSCWMGGGVELYR